MTNRLVEGLDRWGVVGVALLVSLSILGCGTDAPVGPTEGDAPTPVATTLTLSATVLSFSSLGATEQLTATVRDQNGATMSGASVAWASSPLSVASVSSTGLVAAVANGTATVTATSGSATGTASVTVQQVAASVTLSPSSLVLAGPGATATVTASVFDAGGSEITNPDLTWSSSDESIATVISSGLVTAVASGSATITVTSAGQTATKPKANPNMNPRMTASTSVHTLDSDSATPMITPDNLTNTAAKQAVGRRTRGKPKL